MRGRKLSAEEQADVKAELDRVDNSLDERLKGIEIEDLEKNDPDLFALIYSELYKQGEVALRLRDKTSVDGSYEQITKQMKVQEE